MTLAHPAREPHAILRARQRYGIELTVADLKTIEADCSKGLSMIMGRWGDGYARHAVLHKETALIVVIGSDGRVVTILPREAARPMTRLRRNGYAV